MPSTLLTYTQRTPMPRYWRANSGGSFGPLGSLVPRTKNSLCEGSRRQRGRRLHLFCGIIPEAAPLGGWALLLPLLPFWPCLQPSGSDPSTTNGSWIYGGSNINTTDGSWIYGGSNINITPAIRKWVLSCYPTSHQRSQPWGGMQPAFLTCVLCIKGLGMMKLCRSLDEQSRAKSVGEASGRAHKMTRLLVAG